MLTPELLRRLAWAPPVPADVAAIAETLSETGARAWQIDATAQVIADAFVDAGQTVEDPPEAVS
jgi:ribonuclease D